MNRTREERCWAHAVEHSLFGLWDLDLRLELVHYSPQWKARLGFPRVDAADPCASWRCRVHPDDFGPMFNSLRSHFDGCTSTYEMQFRLRSNGSGYRTVLSRGRVVSRDSSGQATRMVGTMADIVGWPANVASYGLAVDLPGAADRMSCLPFHAALGPRNFVAMPHAPVDASTDYGAAASLDSGLLVASVADLLDLAMRDANAAR